MENHGHHWRTGEDREARQSGRRPNRGRQAGPRWPGLSFLVRWAFAVSAAMLVAGLIEFGLARQQVIDQALEESRRDYELLAAGLEDA